MQRRSLVAGIGAIAFGVLPIVAFMVANPPGGNYKASDVADFIAKGHRPAVFVSIYLVLLSAVGLLLLLARLRESIAEGSRTTLFWGFTLVAGIAALAAVAWFPFFLVYLWAIVVGVALVAIELRGSARTVSTQPA
jgi:hypothetical protein